MGLSGDELLDNTKRFVQIEQSACQNLGSNGLNHFLKLCQGNKPAVKATNHLSGILSEDTAERRTDPVGPGGFREFEYVHYKAEVAPNELRHPVSGIAARMRTIGMEFDLKTSYPPCMEEVKNRRTRHVL